MLGAVIGDIVGSRFEWHNIRTKEFALFHASCEFTDDSVMTCAVAKAVMCWDDEGRPSYGRLSELAALYMREFGGAYPGRGYGGHFSQWLHDVGMGPYHSCGNGSAMRVSPVGWAASSMEECLAMSDAVTAVTHDHPDGLLGARATAAQVFLARNGASLGELEAYERSHWYPITYDLAWLQANNAWSSVCDQTCQPAFVCVYASTGFEDCLRNCMSIGGDSDTIGAIAGAIAEAVYGIPADVREVGLSYVDDRLRGVCDEFDARWPARTLAG